MKFVFFGTDDFSVIVFDELKKVGFLPALIVTLPDKPRGRGMRVLPSPVSLWAQKNNIPMIKPQSLKIENLELKITPDLGIVASYGNIVPSWLLAVPRHGMLNVHPSLLPHYRGPSPIESQILANEKDIGVTIMKMDEKMDHGPIVAQRRLEFSIFNFQFSKLRQTLATRGGKLLAETIPRYLSGEVTPTPQDESHATYTRKFAKEDMEIRHPSGAFEDFLKIQAFDGKAYFYTGNTRIKVTDAAFENGELRILRVIPEGKREMSYADFLRGKKAKSPKSL